MDFIGELSKPIQLRILGTFDILGTLENRIRNAAPTKLEVGQCDGMRLHRSSYSFWSLICWR